MVRKLPRSVCTVTGCYQSSIHKRLCPEHFKLRFPLLEVFEYKFRWSVVQVLEGTIRASNLKEARKLIESGVVHAKKVNPDYEPTNLELLEETKCL